MKYLGFDPSVLESKGAIHTAREIAQQPVLWQRVWERAVEDGDGLQTFLDEALSRSKRIILTGAGTSAFIGLSLIGAFQRRTGILTEAIATTDLVSHPRDFLHRDIPTLMISFARSGNSPESVAVLALAEELCSNCYHLIITCNPDGKLAKFDAGKRKYVFALPPEANDQSLAMTSSYTGMLLAGLLIARLKDLDVARKSVDVLAGYGKRLIEHGASEIRKISEYDFKRAVFLGSGPFFGAARESHLKVQELTDGLIICKEDSFLGFRHGPKAVIDDETIVFYLFSNEPYASQYERDLVYSMKRGRKPMLEVGVMESKMPDLPLDYSFSLSDNGVRLDEEFLTVCSVVPAQLLGFFKSLGLGLQPDSPSASGSISRVVEKFQIYELKH